ncbi:MAG: gamma carbonic anhydrase family protein [Proteobacteria bacterium]|nr:gamma carbonic anhydrase family protein [Pseudomonadota bacterium]NDC24953.1 gamma carbonic anhydrase family protein [Pseudomonadota bacterium]NDD04293.1 gamma carbonic anhydrase family protein [Pseudomonadota bacterium]
MPPEPKDKSKHYLPHLFCKPQLDSSVFVAPGAKLIGDVSIGAESSVWFNCVLRGDVNKIQIGKRSNIQDLTLIHESYQSHSTLIGDSVTVGHSCILHACTIGDFSMVGMGSTVLDGAELGEFVLLGAGSLVTQGMKIPKMSKAFGRPAKIVGTLSDLEVEQLKWLAQHYVALSQIYRANPWEQFARL